MRPASVPSPRQERQPDKLGEIPSSSRDGKAAGPNDNASDAGCGASYNSRKTNEIWMLGGMGKSGTLEYIGLAREIPQTISRQLGRVRGQVPVLCIAEIFRF